MTRIKAKLKSMLALLITATLLVSGAVAETETDREIKLKAPYSAGLYGLYPDGTGGCLLLTGETLYHWQSDDVVTEFPWIEGYLGAVVCHEDELYAVCDDHTIVHWAENNWEVIREAQPSKPSVGFTKPCVGMDQIFYTYQDEKDVRYLVSFNLNTGEECEYWNYPEWYVGYDKASDRLFFLTNEYDEETGKWLTEQVFYNYHTDRVEEKMTIPGVEGIIESWSFDAESSTCFIQTGDGVLRYRFGENAEMFYPYRNNVIVALGSDRIATISGNDGYWKLKVCADAAEPT